MSFTKRYLPPLLAIALGIANGVYVFKPSLAEQKEDAIQSTIRSQSQPPATSMPSQNPGAVSSGSQKKGQ